MHCGLRSSGVFLLTSLRLFTERQRWRKRRNTVKIIMKKEDQKNILAPEETSVNVFFGWWYGREVNFSLFLFYRMVLEDHFDSLNFLKLSKSQNPKTHIVFNSQILTWLSYKKCCRSAFCRPNWLLDNAASKPFQIVLFLSLPGTY